MNTNLRRAAVIAPFITGVVALLPAAAMAAEGHHPAAHTDVGGGLGVLTLGLGLQLAHRFENGARVEGGLGTAIVTNGGSLGGGLSWRVFDGRTHTLEVPLMAYGLGGQAEVQDPLAEDDKAPHIHETLFGGGAATGLDWLIGGEHRNDMRFWVSLRAGVCAFDLADPTEPFPIGQLTIGTAL